jgi:pimeloyl-ACP methyl ester carboxylesterase
MGRRVRLSRRRVALIVGLLASACTSSARKAGPEPSTTTAAVAGSSVPATTAITGGSVAATPPSTAGPGYTASYAKTSCDDVVPADARVECGTLTVPADRADLAKGTVTIPVAIIHAASATAAKDPIIYFSGGPGFPGRTIAGYFLDQDMGGDRDMIVFDQRGTGASTPSLDCPEVVEPVWAALGAAGDPVAEGRTTAAALLACRSRLVAQGVDLDAYNTPATAADVEDLRAVLGIDRWNLFGVSYGTRVALEVARRDPTHVRSVVLDSTIPPDVAPTAAHRIATANRVFDVLAAGCKAAPACAAHGDVALNVQTVFDAWTASPFQTTVEDPATHQQRSVAITGSDVIAGLWNALYDSRLIGVLPSLLPGLLARGDVAQAAVNQLAASGINQLTGYAEAMQMSVDCADTERLGGISGVDAAATVDPRWQSLLTLGASVPCPQWGVRPVDASFNSPVLSGLPALVLGDEYDPVTPPADSQRVASGFANGTYVFFTGLGHGAVFASTCAQATFHAFMADPNTKPDTSCAASGAPGWA